MIFIFQEVLMNSRNLIITLCATMCIGNHSLLTAESLSGTVRDESTKQPIEGAAVALAQAQGSAVTNAAGTWEMQVTSIRNRAAQQTPFSTPIFAGNRLHFNVKNSSEFISIKLFSLKGKQLQPTVIRNYKNGSHSFELSEVPAGMFIAELRANNRCSRIRCLNIGDTSRGEANRSGYTDQLFKKQQAMVDTLIVTIDGYNEARKAIADYSGTHVIFLEKQ